MSAQETFESIAATAVDGVLRSVAAWLVKNKDVSVSVDELRKALVMPAVSSTPGRARNTPTGIPGRDSSRRGASARSEEEARLEEEGQLEGFCHYVRIRGKNRGRFCTSKAAQSNGKYCSACSKKSGPKAEIESGVVGMPSGKSTRAGVAPGHRSSAIPEDVEEEELQATAFTDELALLEKYNLIVNSETSVVVAQLVGPNGDLVPLDSAAIALAKKLDLDYDTSVYEGGDEAETQKEDDGQQSSSEREQPEEPASTRQTTRQRSTRATRSTRSRDQVFA